IDRHLEGLWHLEVWMRGNVPAIAAAVILPTMIEARDVIAAHEAETKLHATMRTAIFPDMRHPAGIAPDHQFLAEQACAGGASGLNRMRQSHRMPVVSGAHFQLPLCRQGAVMTRNFQNEAIIGTKAACHL